MKSIISFLCAIGILLQILSSCKKDGSKLTSTGSLTNTYSSVGDFLAKHNPNVSYHTLSAVNGGSFVTSLGTQVFILPNSFISYQTGNLVTDSVRIEFQDLYKKSDILLANMCTATNTGSLLKTGGQFHVKITSKGQAVKLATGRLVVVNQPLALTGGVDPYMKTYNVINSAPSPIGNWVSSPTDSLSSSPQFYIYKMYSFSNVSDSGSWCNSDNPSFFSSYPQTNLTIHSNDSISLYKPYVYLVFKNINSMVYIHATNSFDFTYSFAPLGLECTAVIVAVRNNTLYSDFIPITIGNNQTYSISLSQTNETDLFQRLDSLN